MNKHTHPEIIVAIYRKSPEGLAYFHLPAFGNMAIDSLIDDLPWILANEPSAPKINGKTMQQLESMLWNALQEFASGSLADVRVGFPLKEGDRAYGFHRMPVSADRDTDSVLVITMNRFGNLSEMRCRPTAEAMAVKAAVFRGEVPHAH